MALPVNHSAVWSPLSADKDINNRAVSVTLPLINC